MNDEPIKVSGEEEMEKPILSMGNIETLVANENAWMQMTEKLSRLLQNIWYR